MPWEKQFDVNQTLEKAMQTFWNRGYEATSMQDLVESTGINRASLYATYGDKHELFLAALKRYEHGFAQKNLVDLESRYGPREAIRQLFLSFTSRAMERSSRSRCGCFLTNTAMELAAHDPDAEEIVVRAQKGVEGFFARMIRKGQAAGEIGPQVKSKETASRLLALLIGLSVLCRSRPERILLQTIVDDAVRCLD
jgi:TetR/AcrR family transcriptional regulator, transcriptional repressor for nem operon